MADFEDAFETLAEPELWMDVGLVIVGVVAPALAKRGFETYAADLPNEVYGLGTIVGAFVVPSDYRHQVQIGAGANVAMEVADRSDAANFVPSVPEV